jgi:hypothetical protein
MQRKSRMLKIRHQYQYGYRPDRSAFPRAAFSQRIIAFARPTGMASVSALMMKLAMPVSLTLILSRKRGERSEGGAAKQTNRYASFTLSQAMQS